MNPQRRAFARTVVAALFAAMALACAPKNNGTLLVVEVDSDVPAGEVDRLDIDVNPGRGKAASASFLVGPGRAPPYRFALVPEGDPALDVEIVARAFKGAQAVLTLAAAVRFQPGAARETTLFLSRECLAGGRTCPGAQQCVAGGGCVPKAQVAALRPLGTRIDGGSPPDAGSPPPPDAAPDLVKPPRDARPATGSWMAATPPALSGGLTAVAVAPGGREIWAVGAGGALGFAFRYDGNAWTPMPLPPGTRPLSAVHVAAPGDVWMVGSAGTVLHRVGEAFTPVPGAGPANLSTVFGAAPDQVWLAGGRTVLRWDGMRLEPAADGLDADVVAGAAAPGGQPWLVGPAGAVFRRAERAWVRAATGLTGAILYGVWASARGDVFAVGAGVALHFDGSAWLAHELMGGAAHGVFGTDVDDVWAVGRNRDQGGAIWRFDGAAWSEVVPLTMPPSPTPVGPLLGIHGAGTVGMWAVGKDAVLRHP